MAIQHDSWIKLLVNSLTKVSKNGSPLQQFLKRHLPYLGRQSLRLKKKLYKLSKEQLPSGKLEIVFRSTQRMSSCFRFKAAIPRSLLSSAIYEYKCSRLQF